MSDNAIGPIFNPPVKSKTLKNYKFDNCSRLGFFPSGISTLRPIPTKQQTKKRANYKASYIQIIYCFLPKKSGKRKIFCRLKQHKMKFVFPPFSEFPEEWERENCLTKCFYALCMSFLLFPESSATQVPAPPLGFRLEPARAFLMALTCLPLKRHTNVSPKKL